VDAGSVARTTNAQAGAVLGELFGPTGAVIGASGLGLAGVVVRLVQVATRNNERVSAEKRIREEHDRTWPEAQAEALRLAANREVSA
jgi:phage-related tail protein